MTRGARAVQTRRGFLRGLWLGLVAGLGGAWAGGGFARSRVAEGSPIATALARLFPDPRGARALGAAYLRAHPRTGAAELLAAIAPLALGPETPSRAALAAQCRRDFDAGRIERVGGWMLARSEAALCALLALDDAGLDVG